METNTREKKCPGEYSKEPASQARPAAFLISLIPFQFLNFLNEYVERKESELRKLTWDHLTAADADLHAIVPLTGQNAQVGFLSDWFIAPKRNFLLLQRN